MRRLCTASGVFAGWLAGLISDAFSSAENVQGSLLPCRRRGRPAVPSAKTSVPANATSVPTTPPLIIFCSLP